MLKLMSQPNLDRGFVVPAFAGVIYDWGEHDDIKELLIAYKFF
jgi:hypothetical protein